MQLRIEDREWRRRGPCADPLPSNAQRLDGVALASQASGEISRRMNSS